MNPELIIFDCDGVLIDSELIACSADAAELTKAGYEITTQEVVRRFAGVPAKEMYAAIEIELGHTLPRDIKERVAQNILDRYESELRAIPGVRNTLPTLPIPFCVASSSEPIKLRLGLSNTNLLQFFEPHVYSTAQVARGKPSPDVFLYASKQFGALDENCIVVEDSVAGITAAVAAGMHPLGFVGGSHCDSSHGHVLRDAGAYEVLDRFEDLLEVIQRLS